MGACPSCLLTHNRDVRESGRCWCSCHAARDRAVVASRTRPLGWLPLDEIAPGLGSQFARLRAAVESWEPAPCPPLRIDVPGDRPRIYADHPNQNLVRKVDDPDESR